MRRRHVTGSVFTRLRRDARGATTLEWTLLLAAIALPSWYVFNLLLKLLVVHYQMLTLLNSLPFP